MMKKEYITPEANVYTIEGDDILDQANQTYTKVDNAPLDRKDDGNEEGEGGGPGFGGWTD